MEGEEKMKVILLEDLKGRGKKNDVIEVASGYATFLLSQKKAIEANQVNLDALHQELEKKANEEKMHIKLMQKLKDDIQGKSVQIEIKVGVDGKLFGNVTTKMIADALEEQLGMTIDKRKIEIDKSINSLGIHNVTVDLHKDVRAEFQVHIIKK
jgi:ribosomal protein L9